MESALAWIGQIFTWIGLFVPRWVIVDTTHAGVKFVRGAKVVPVKAGIAFYWPVTTNFVYYPVAAQSNNLKSQTIMTADDKSILVGGMIMFEIVDIEKILAHTWEPDNTISDLCLGAIHDVCCGMTWAEIREGQRTGKLGRAMRAEAKRFLDPYGVRVLRMTLTDLAPVRVLKLVQATTTD